MDEDFLDRLLPSLLVFSGVAFSLLFSVPPMRASLKETFEKNIKASKGFARIVEFWAYQFYRAITRRLYPFGAFYVIGVVLVLLCPVSCVFRIPAWLICLLTTVGLLVFSGHAAYKAFTKLSVWVKLTVDIPLEAD